MNTLITLLSIMTIAFFASYGSTRAATLLVSNQMKTRGNIPVFVTCQGLTHDKISKIVPSGQVSMIDIITPNAKNTASDENAAPAASRVPQLTSCVGSFNGEAHFWPAETLYGLYDSDKDSTECNNVCLVVVKDDGFYRWNNDKNAWNKITPIIWI
ncbi:unnamed protein product [Cochlearia groenlandica]